MVLSEKLQLITLDSIMRTKHLHGAKLPAEKAIKNRLAKNVSMNNNYENEIENSNAKIK